MTRPFRLRRSELSTPGSNPKMIERAAASDADLVFLDLEDAVAPAEKVPARRNVIEGLNGLDWGRKTRAVRINGTHTHWCYEDIVEVVTGAGANLDVIIVPKPKAPRDVWFVDTLLSQLERQLGLEEGRIGLELLIEETEALARVEEIAACCPRVEALILGFGDFSASQGMRLSLHGRGEGKYPGDPWHYHRNRMIVAARANGLDAIDGPFADFRDEDGYRTEATWASALGAVGKWAIHPSQVPVANSVFSPTEAEIARAQRMIDQVRAAEAAGAGAAAAGGVMIDAATERIFQQVLDRARLIESLGR
jgi:citrate lyase subunit beta/citryl-CoA lyase